MLFKNELHRDIEIGWYKKTKASLKSAKLLLNII